VMLMVLLAGVVWTGCDDDDDNDDARDLNQNDLTFAQNASLSNSVEIDFGQLAVSRGTDSLVRAYAQMMIDEHTQAQEDLDNAVEDFDNVDLTGNMDQQHQQLREQLMSLSGNSFDSLYITSQITDHERTLTLFQNAQTNSSESKIRSYAQKYTPHIQQHLVLADSIQTVVMNNISNGSDGENNGD
jgi:putative membrane protein